MVWGLHPPQALALPTSSEVQPALKCPAYCFSCVHESTQMSGPSLFSSAEQAVVLTTVGSLWSAAATPGAATPGAATPGAATPGAAPAECAQVCSAPNLCTALACHCSDSVLVPAARHCVKFASFLGSKQQARGGGGSLNQLHALPPNLAC